MAFYSNKFIFLFHFVNLFLSLFHFTNMAFIIIICYLTHLQFDFILITASSLPTCHYGFVFVILLSWLSSCHLVCHYRFFLTILLLWLSPYHFAVMIFSLSFYHYNFFLAILSLWLYSCYFSPFPLE